jgi:N-acetylglucosaminyldiphosphoundecaprenol N-acetyl-beta-D-mannosaminyltransferase
MTDDRRGEIGAVAFTVMTLPDAVARVLAESTRRDGIDGEGCAVHFANAFNVALARKDPAYRSLLSRGDLVFSDGVPITWVGKLAYPDLAPAWQRVYGPDVMTAVLASTESPRHYLLGGTTETLASLQRRIDRDFPLAQIVGAESPPFAPPSAAELAERNERIRESGATMVWVGLGTPKQDVEVRRLADSLPVVALAVGAAFDFLAGTKPQAPAWMQRSGTEWAFRLASEPTRLGRRYVWGNSVFLAEATRTLVRTRSRD